MRRLIVVLGFLAVAQMLARDLRAQVVTGQVVDSTSRVPVGTGFVVLLDESDNEVARSLTTTDGRFELHAPRPGTYSLRSERIGYRAFESEPIALATNESLSYTLQVTAIPIVLSTVEVTAEDRCQVSPDRASETGVLWEEIRKALAATAWDGTQELARYRTYSFERELTSNRRRVMRERGTIREGVARQPYVSRPAAWLAEHGYVIKRAEETVYSLPDAKALTEDAFLSTHCFHVVRDPDRRSGQVGLAFEPVSRSGLPDVRGMLWLDEESSQLKALEAWFTRLPDELDDDRVSGTVEFLMLPSGAWVVDRWVIRTPIMQVSRAVNPFDRHRRQTLVHGFRDIGREVLEITVADGTVIYPPGLAQVTGTVFDSTKGRGLSGVRVTLGNTDFWTSTDSSGVFHLTTPLEGDYPLILSHAWLDSVLYYEESLVSLKRGRVDSLAVNVPPVSSSIRRFCTSMTDVDNVGVVFGTVGNEGSVEPASGVTVSASWQILQTEGGQLRPRTVEAETKTGDSGLYVLCGVPLGRAISLHAYRDGAASRTANILIPKSEQGSVLHAWDRTAGAAYDESRATLGRSWKLDFRLSESRPTGMTIPQGHILSGFVTDRSTGQAAGGVTISLNGRDTTATRPDGTFELADIEWNRGVNIIAMRRLGYQPWVQEIWLGAQDERLDLSVSLTPQVIELHPVEVTATVMEQYLTDVGYYRREERNRGMFLHRETIAEQLGRVNHVTELLTGMAGVVVIDPHPGVLRSSLSFRGMLSVRGCGEPKVFVDGFLTNLEDLDLAVRPEDVYALEVYRTPSEIPAQYGGAESACGVLLIWTRRGR